MLCSLIMAGGKGTRFWPKSTSKMPKQFLNLVKDETMLQMTLNRVNNVIPLERTFIVTCQEYKEIVKKQIPELPERNIIIEPIGRNTAPCILLSTLYIKQIYGNVNIAVLPADHIISKEDKFIQVLNTADNYLENYNNNNIITVGIKPNRPETGYGYIKYLDDTKESAVCQVEKFVEKPNLDKAKEYLEDGSYLWNAGMFIFNSEFMLSELECNFKDSYNILNKLPSINDSNYMNVLKQEYQKCEAISIDYAIMEKSNSIKVIPADLGWDDIGTWKSLQRYIKPDKDANIIKGEAKIYNSSNNVVYAGEKKVMLIDIDGLYVIETDDTIVIGKAEKIDEVYLYRNK